MTERISVSDHTHLAALGDRPIVAVYREMLLSYNEPFVLAQGETLRHYRSYYIGAHRVAELDTPRERTLLLREC